MRPDLFAGPALRDDGHRILARLANGGIAPAPLRQRVLPWHAAKRARIAAVASLLAIAAAAWVCLAEERPAASVPPEIAAGSRPPLAPEANAPRDELPAGSVQPQTATIVSTPVPPTVAASAAGGAVSVSAGAKTATAGGAGRPKVVAVQAAPPPVRQRAGKPAQTLRNLPSAADSDEDVTLLAAMLKHANPPKPTPAPPGNR